VHLKTAEAVAEGGYRAIRQIVTESGNDFPYTAVIAYNDYSALGVQRALLESGYQIPRDVSLVACSDSGICDYLPIRLTAVRENWHEVGRQSFHTLEAQLQGEIHPPRSTIVPTELIVRDSTTRPR